MKVVILLVLAALMEAARSFSADPAMAPSVSLTFGYLLLTAFFTGGIFGMLRLPKLTGYIVAGVVVGPSALGYVHESILPSLQIFNGVAVAMIALSAGVELEVRSMRPLFRSIALITLVANLLAMPLLAVTVYALRADLPFMVGLSSSSVIAVSVVLGIAMAAKSPAVVFALRGELAADGPVTRTVLAVVVVSDLLTLVLFAGASAVARSSIGGSADMVQTVLLLAWELLGSIVAGGVIGLLLTLYLRKVPGGAAMFIAMVCFTVAEVGQRIHFDPLLLSLAAGIVVRNFSDAGDRLQGEIAKSSLPVYVIFFAVAGAKIDLSVMPVVGLLAAILVGIRATALLGGARIGARLARADEAVVRYAGLGLLPQAGLAIALAQVFAKAFPELGDSAPALVLAVVAINEIISPAFYRLGLVRSGEASRGKPPEPVFEPVHDSRA